jgi:outer membrane protein assembly factor BamB
VAVAAVAALGSAGVAATVLSKPRPIEKRGNPVVEFQRAKAPSKLQRKFLAGRAPTVSWPLWGLGPTRNRVVPGRERLRPPFRVSYVVHGRAMIEFPPVVAYRKLYVGTHAGQVIAARVRDGRVAWTRDLGYCIASSPAVGKGVVYVTTKGIAPCQRHPEMKSFLFALDARTGRTLWRVRTGLVESSPLLSGRTLYFGSYDSPDSSTVWALDVRTRRPRWIFSVPSKITSSPALLGHRLYIGAYSTTLYALDSRNGKLLFASSPPGDYSGHHGFYGTPSIAYNRVYIGGLDGRVYAFGARTGVLRWATAAGSYVYSSPAVWKGLVFAGACMNNRFFAFDAATGRIRWSFKANGRILGSPTVLAGVVYFSTTSDRTYALDAMMGAELWQFADGQFSPIVVAGKRVLLTGKGRVYGLEPLHPPALALLGVGAGSDSRE